MSSTPLFDPLQTGPGPAPAASRPGAPARCIVEMIGDTPLLRTRRIRPANPHVELLLKAEWFNPGGSVKDRAARQIILDAEARGDLGPGRRLLDASSGNTGIAYAMIAASRGWEVEICLPANANAERKRLLAIYGAHVVPTDPMEGTDGAIREARRRVAAAPERYYYADQYSNPSNWQAHLKTTGPELWAQTDGALTHLVAGLGTTGTLMGTGRYLKARDPSITLVAVQPDSPYHGMEGLKHLETAMVPSIYDPLVPDVFEEQETEEAFAMARRLAREEGLLVGISGAGIVAAALRVASRLERGVVVAIVPDGGNRYLSDRFWTEP